jgi:adenosylmethionine-8-amino-7-oxononanoate aminotransferase
VLLIADEVAVGMGRTGRMFACEHEDVAPDLLCLAKGLTGGYLPLAATLTTDEIWEAFLEDDARSKTLSTATPPAETPSRTLSTATPTAETPSRTFFHGHTYGGNPLGAAVALATLDVFEEERTLEQLRPKIARLADHLARLAELPHVGHVRQCGLIAGIELVRDGATKEPYPWTEQRGIRVCDYARGEGVLLRPLGDVIVIMPPLAISLEQLDRIAGAVERGILSATRS